MADIKIIVDSGSDIPQDIADKYNIGVISFLSIFSALNNMFRELK